MLPIWLKNSKGKYIVSPYLPIAGYSHLLVTLPNGRRGFYRRTIFENPALLSFIEGSVIGPHRLFDFYYSEGKSLGLDVYMLKDEF